MLSRIVPEKLNIGKCQFLQRSIEPDKNGLEASRAKTEDLPESLKSRADIELNLNGSP